MDKNTHVYCTECINGKQLIESIIEDNILLMPKECESCYPWNPEDSFRFEERPNYKPV